MSLLEREHLALLLRVNAILNSSLDLQEVLNSLIDQVIEALGAERGFVLLRQDGEWKVAAGRTASGYESFHNVMFSRSIVDKVAETGEPVKVLDAYNDPNFASASITLTGIHSILCVPLSWGSEVKGAVYADHRVKTGVFSEAQLELLTAIADQAARALENAALHRELQQVHESAMEQARRELSEAQSQLLEASKLAAVGQLAAGIAHEVNNPLCALAINLKAVAKKLNKPPLEKRLGLMQTALDRCQQIIERLLRFAHPSKADKRQFRLDEELSETLELVRYQFVREEVELNCHLEETTIEGDPAQLNQVFLNLLFNALDALRDKDGPKSLTVVCSQGPKEASIFFKDNGPGMTEEVRARVFEPFFTTKEVGQGVGLGLALCYRILQEHQAEFTVTSKPGEGATFQLNFPQGTPA